MTYSGRISKHASPHVQVDIMSLLRNAKPKQKLKSDTASIELNEDLKSWKTLHLILLTYHGHVTLQLSQHF